jgi:hypothetical protein
MCNCECHKILPKFRTEWCLECSKKHVKEENELLEYLIKKLMSGEFDDRKSMSLGAGKVSGTQLKRIVDAISDYYKAL